MARSSNAERSLVHCRSSRDKSHAPWPATRPPLRAVPNAASSFDPWRSCSPSPARRASASALARSRAPVSSKSVTDVRSMRAPCVCRETARRMPSICVAAAAVTLPVRMTEPPTTRGEAAEVSPSHAGAERSNCMTYCSASLSNAARSPWRCKRSKSASHASTDSLVSTSLSMPSSSCRRASTTCPLANRSAAFSSTAHSPGFACATSNEACAGAHWARLAPVTVMSPPAGSTRRRAPLLPACAVSSRAEAHARTDIGLERLGLFLGRWFRKERHFCPGTSIRDRGSAIPAASAPDPARPNGNSLALLPTLIMFPS